MCFRQRYCARTCANALAARITKRRRIENRLCISPMPPKSGCSSRMTPPTSSRYRSEICRLVRQPYPALEKSEFHHPCFSVWFSKLNMFLLSRHELTDLLIHRTIFDDFIQLGPFFLGWSAAGGGGYFLCILEPEKECLYSTSKLSDFRIKLGICILLFYLLLSEIWQFNFEELENKYFFSSTLLFKCLRKKNSRTN